MRSMKRPRRSVHRYKSLLFPGIALVFIFYAALLSPKLEKGETMVFEYENLRLEVTNVCTVANNFGRFDGETFEPVDTYVTYPGARLTVLDADMREDTDGVPCAVWAIVPQRGGEAQPIVDGMEPLEFARNGMEGVQNLETGEIVLGLDHCTEDGETWK